MCGVECGPLKFANPGDLVRNLWDLQNTNGRDYDVGYTCHPLACKDVFCNQSILLFRIIPFRRQYFCVECDVRIQIIFLGEFDPISLNFRLKAMSLVPVWVEVC